MKELQRLTEKLDTYKLFQTAGCDLAKTMEPALFIGLYEASNKHICNGCHMENQNCKAQKKIANAANVEVKAEPSKKTNAEWAAELNVSKRQVAKMRRAGVLEE